MRTASVVADHLQIFSKSVARVAKRPTTLLESQVFAYSSAALNLSPVIGI